MQNISSSEVSLFQKAPRQAHRVHAQRGFDLVQIAIVVGVIGVLMAAAFMGVPRVMASVKATGDAQDLQAYALTIKEIPPVVKIDEQYFKDNGLYPNSQQSGPGGTPTWVNRFGGAVTFAGGANGSSLLVGVKSAAVSTLACEKLVPIVAGTFDQITIGDTKVKVPNGSLLEPGKIRTACTGTGPTNDSVTIEYLLYR